MNTNKNWIVAEELAEKLNDRDNIGFYYKLAQNHEHGLLYDILSWVTDYPKPGHKGKLFTWRLKNKLIEKNIPIQSSKPSANKLDEIRKKLNNQMGNKWNG